MTEKTLQYDAGNVEDYYWIECVVRLPGDRDDKTGNYKDFACTAKVECADVIDALDLDRWTTQAFQYMWRSGRKKGNPATQELAKAAWFLERGFLRGHHWQASACDVVAHVLEHSLDRYGSQTMPLGLAELAKALRERDPEAVAIVAEAYAEEGSRSAKKFTPAMGVG